MNDLGWAVVGGVLWLIIGGLGVWLAFVVTFFGTGILAALEKPKEASIVFIGGIIVSVLALIYVVVNVVMSIISIVQIATGG